MKEPYMKGVAEPSWPRAMHHESKEYDGNELLQEVGQPNSTCETFEQALWCAAVCGEDGERG